MILDNNIDIEEQYLATVEDILFFGTKKDDRTGVGTISQFGHTLRHDLSQGFPCLTTKKVLWQKAFDEMLWMISGSTNINDLPKRSQVIWKAWSDKDGNIGEGYGKQMRRWTSFYPIYKKESIWTMRNFTHEEQISYLPKHLNSFIINEEYEKLDECISLSNPSGYSMDVYKYEVDQIKKIQWQLRNNPNDRRIVLNLWNVSELEDMSLVPCHLLSIFNVQDGKLNCLLTLRSNDMFLGNPFNLCGYAMLVHLFAYCCDLEVGILQVSIADAHIYNNHTQQIEEQLKRKPFKLPKFVIKEGTPKEITEIKIEHIDLIDYESHGMLKGAVAV